MSNYTIQHGKPPRGGRYAARSVPPFRVRTDPPVRADGLCVVSTCTRVVPALALLHLDPFCSTGCCRAWYGVET